MPLWVMREGYAESPLVAGHDVWQMVSPVTPPAEALLTEAGREVTWVGRVCERRRLQRQWLMQ